MLELPEVAVNLPLHERDAVARVAVQFLKARGLADVGLGGLSVPEVQPRLRHQVVPGGEVERLFGIAPCVERPRPLEERGGLGVVPKVEQQGGLLLKHHRAAQALGEVRGLGVEVRGFAALAEGFLRVSLPGAQPPAQMGRQVTHREFEFERLFGAAREGERRQQVITHQGVGVGGEVCGKLRRTDAVFQRRRARRIFGFEGAGEWGSAQVRAGLISLLERAAQLGLGRVAVQGMNVGELQRELGAHRGSPLAHRLLQGIEGTRIIVTGQGLTNLFPGGFGSDHHPSV